MATASGGAAGDSAEGGDGKKGSTGGRGTNVEPREVSRTESAGVRSEVNSRLTQLGLTPTRHQIALLWDGEADLDLHVVTGAGERLWRQDRDSPSGGRFQSTAAAAGKPLEIVYWSELDEPTWPLSIEIRYPPPDNESATTVAYKVVVSFDGGSEKAFSGEVAPSTTIKLTPIDRNADEADR